VHRIRKKRIDNLELIFKIKEIKKNFNKVKKYMKIKNTKFDLNRNQSTIFK